MSSGSHGARFPVIPLELFRAALFVHVLRRHGGFSVGGWQHIFQFPEAFSPAELTAAHGWLRSKGNSIEGGTSEVNLNVVAKRVLGLPDPK